MAKILVVDDEPYITLLLRHNLKDDGHEVIEVNGGEEALLILRKDKEENGRSFDIVILDIFMPTVDGGEVLKRIKHEINSELLVIMYTAFEDSALPYGGFTEKIKEMADEYVVKNSDGEELKKAIERCLIKINNRKKGGY